VRVDRNDSMNDCRAGSRGVSQRRCADGNCGTGKQAALPSGKALPRAIA
jgi:hypothetical protein